MTKNSVVSPGRGRPTVIFTIWVIAPVSARDSTTVFLRMNKKHNTILIGLTSKRTYKKSLLVNGALTIFSSSQSPVWKSHQDRTVIKFTTGMMKRGATKQIKYNATSCVYLYERFRKQRYIEDIQGRVREWHNCNKRESDTITTIHSSWNVRVKQAK